MDQEGEPSVTAREIHTPPRGVLSAAGFIGEAQKHRRRSRGKREEQPWHPRVEESRELSRACVPRVGEQKPAE